MDQILDTILKFSELSTCFSRFFPSCSSENPFVLTEFEINPFVFDRDPADDCPGRIRLLLPKRKSLPDGIPEGSGILPLFQKYGGLLYSPRYCRGRCQRGRSDQTGQYYCIQSSETETAGCLLHQPQRRNNPDSESENAPLSIPGEPPFPCGAGSGNSSGGSCKRRGGTRQWNTPAGESFSYPEALAKPLMTGDRKRRFSGSAVIKISG